MAALLLAAALIALIAGFTGWSIRSRDIAAEALPTQHPNVALQPVDQSMAADAMVSKNPLPGQPRAGFLLDVRRRLLNNRQGIPAAVAVARQRLKSQFSSEPVDGPWASRKEKALAAANDSPQIEQLGAKPLAFDSACHASTCLISADFPTATEAEDWFSMYTLVAGPEMSHAAVERSSNPDGTIHLQIYGQARN